MKHVIALIVLLFGVLPLKAAAPKVVVSLAPLHSLACDLMEGVAVPDLLIPQEVSGHDYALKPSQIRLLENADLVVWVGPLMESFLGNIPFSKTKTSFTLMSLEGLKAWPSRGRCQGHDHGTHDHDHAHIHNHDHDCGESDPHVWLSVDNALVLVRALAAKLIAQDPAHQGLYKTNLDRLEEKLRTLRLDMAALLEPLQHKTFFVFHDAFQYLERDFHLGPSLHLTLDPEQGMSLKHMKVLRAQVQQHPGSPLIAEQTLGKERVARLGQKLDLRVVLVDPMGFDEKTLKPLSYTHMMRNLADTFASALALKDSRP